MSVECCIFLKKKVDDLDKADDWFEEVKEALMGHTDCVMQAQSSNHEAKIDIIKEPS